MFSDSSSNNDDEEGDEDDEEDEEDEEDDYDDEDEVEKDYYEEDLERELQAKFFASGQYEAKEGASSAGKLWRKNQRGGTEWVAALKIDFKHVLDARLSLRSYGWDVEWRFGWLWFWSTSLGYV